MIDVKDIPEQQLTYIKQHLTECSPQEGCGLLVDSGGGLEYWPVINSAADKMNSFRIAPQDFAEAEDAVTSLPSSIRIPVPTVWRIRQSRSPAYAGDVLAVVHLRPGQG